MSKFTFLSHSEEQTMKFAESVARKLMPGTVLTLEGDLGAGKTTFTKGLARGLGITRTVNSPTFTIIKEYTQGTIPLYHMDVYRLEESDEDLGFDEYFNGNGITVVEWAQFIKDQLPNEWLNINILRVSDHEREIVLQPKGNRYLDLCKEIAIDESISN
ncbi:tRNA (adenosine(37)-N6)-threonylcarbamoyltransferase complex ATPase subunit type 1 TsaE [Calidifontibacillus oryziterrae]|uniref:tRNA (adenosine(37)-N6)-threonylcarbamoyltransferase complex ATPase subunit type 1 TsaE n=1 Tax=Calidifontibacillus oryziterrae TaxID=1191699 RepID=UPI0003116970|nr:tRNA (adenosine(37)-N6)-threonylcarbamoyltransferase complex ATPase subunit type 1 TsaE [Calidifontibacillus oryziterrae]